MRSRPCYVDGWDSIPLQESAPAAEPCDDSGAGLSATAVTVKW